MEDAVNRYRENAETHYRNGSYEHSRYITNYMEEMKADCRRAGYDFHPFEPLTNLEYLEFKVAEKENRHDEILHKRYPFWSCEHH
jgi:hypothetical protein